MSDIAQHIAVSHKVNFEDLDWEKARKIGLTRQEIESLTYFADIESQTVLLPRGREAPGRTRTGEDHAMWNYEGTSTRMP